MSATAELPSSIIVAFRRVTDTRIQGTEDTGGGEARAGGAEDTRTEDRGPTHATTTQQQRHSVIVMPPFGARPQQTSAHRQHTTKAAPHEQDRRHVAQHSTAQHSTRATLAITSRRVSEA